MDAYRRVVKEKTPVTQENEIRVIAAKDRSARSYISYALNLLDGKTGTIVVKAMGKAMNKAITVTETIKRRVAGLHQIITFETVELVDKFEPVVKDLRPKEVTHVASCISVTLSKAPLNTADPGYQAPLPNTEVVPESEAKSTRAAHLREARADTPPTATIGRGRGRGRGQGGRGGRGRGNSTQGRGRGGSPAGRGQGGRGGRGAGRGRGRGRS
eukprot:NODE_6600_length_834_cov_8.949367_g6364_i0.p1 GENE.NODE_6600_length_834_cov_8.949367_g6364_i0~~NODE_6600_length_834_cov_8.949367_g6364_i0.p1  ORF type:complete len:231 (-),score=48.01 NODE_6600_length_834_cov_8.949367_g6364_i0:141-782(-)